MDRNLSDDIIITALFKRLTTYRLPRLLELEKRVSAGETLNEFDMVFLETVFSDAQYIFPLADKHPEHQEIVSKIIQMYSDITKKALENQRTS